jgi:hypothetical protein
VGAISLGLAPIFELFVPLLTDKGWVSYWTFHISKGIKALFCSRGLRARGALHTLKGRQGNLFAMREIAPVTILASVAGIRGDGRITGSRLKMEARETVGGDCRLRC